MGSVIGEMMDVVFQLHTIMPESALFGSILLYFLTLNKPFGIFAIFIVELILSHKFISWIFIGTTGPSRSPPVQCLSGYKTSRFNIQRIIPKHQYPSYGVFSITAMATYLGLSTNEFSDTMKSIGTQWEGRTMIAYMFILAVLLLVIIVRLAFCEPFIEILIGFITAIICGAIFFKLNTLIFGVESVNFLGLPYLVSKDSVNDKIYVCSKSNDPVDADQCSQ